MSSDSFLGVPWDDFARTWFLGSEPTVVEEQARRGLDAIQRWLPARLKSITSAHARGPAIIEPLIRLGLRIADAETLPGFGDLAHRLANDENGAYLELLLVAALLSLGHRPDLEPDADAAVGAGGKRNDAAIMFAGARVHFEATFADQSDEGSRAQSVAHDIASVLVETQDCSNVFVWTTQPLEADRLSALVDAVRHAPLDVLVDVSDIGYVRKTNCGDQSGPEPPDIGPMLVIAKIKVQGGVQRIVTIRQPAIDLRVPKLLDKKGAQMGPNANIVVIGVNNIPAKMADLAPQVSRRFQPAINRRFGAAVLVRTSFPMDEMVSVTEWHIIANPYASEPIPEELLRQIATLDGTTL